MRYRDYASLDSELSQTALSYTQRCPDPWLLHAAPHVCSFAFLLVCGQRGGGAQREARADAPLLASIGSRGGDADTTSAGERSLHVSPWVALAA